MSGDIAYLHIATSSFTDKYSKCWYFTHDFPVEFALMEIFFVSLGVVTSDTEVDRKIHGHSPEQLRTMFQEISLVAFVT